MAKKKSTTQSESNPQDQIHNHMDDAVSDKLDTLKSLNSMLLKETVERRQQVDLLVQSNGSLESQLNRSVMDNASLQSQMNDLTEKAVMLEIEKGLVSVFVVAQTNQLAEERIESLKGEMKTVLEENSEKESEIGDLNSKLGQLMAEIAEDRVVSSRVRDEITAQLDARIQEVNELQLKVTESEKMESQIQEEVKALKVNNDRLVEENTASVTRIDSIMSEKDSIQMNLIESNGQVDELKRNIEELLDQKKAIEDEKNTYERKNNELQTSVDKLNDSLQSMRVEEEALFAKVADFEKRYAESSRNEVEMQMKIDGFVEDKKETDVQIESLVKEKNLVTQGLEDAKQELEHQKLTIKQIVQEKTELENTKIQLESEIVKMKEQLSEFEGMVSSLEHSRMDQIEKLKQFEVEASSYKASFDRATIERDEARASLHKEKAITTDNKQKIMNMEKEIEDSYKELEKMTAENGKHSGEKNELQNRYAALLRDMDLLETKLAETRIESDDTKLKLGLTEANLNRVLIILKKTLLSCDENTDFDQENGVEEGIEAHVTEVEAIKRAFNDKESIVEDMKRELVLVKSYADEAHKGKSFWTMVSSATTLLAAAASVAYVARSH